MFVPTYPYLSVAILNDLLDQPMYWPNYTWQPYQAYQAYYATVPATTVVPTTAAPPSVVQHSVYPPPQPQA